MDILLNVAIWALLLVHMDSTVVAGQNLNVTPSLTSSSSDNGGPGPIPGSESPATLEGSSNTTVLHASQSNTTHTALDVAAPPNLDPSTVMPRNEKNTANGTEISLPKKQPSLPEAPTESHHLSSTTITTTTITPTSTPLNTEHPNPSQTLSSTQAPSTPITVSAEPDKNTSSPTGDPAHSTTTPTPATSHPTKPAAHTTSTSAGSIPATQPPENVTSGQQHREPFSAHSDMPAETSRAAHLVPTTTPLSSSSAQAKARADTPSQLSVGEAATVVHESTAVDPLLAGLVSAFIISAVIITLLLFLKLRRRDNRPVFRRLQDLPMDDMMEDTPLSMYSY